MRFSKKNRILQIHRINKELFRTYSFEKFLNILHIRH